jgi:hypothetical protein
VRTFAIIYVLLGYSALLAWLAMSLAKVRAELDETSEELLAERVKRR